MVVAGRAERAEYMSEVELQSVTKRFSGGAAVSGVSLSVGKGELLVIVGPSGCGKSTLLRIVAGLEQPDEGDVGIAGHSVVNVAPQDRDIAMVFQGYALYPHMTVRQNIEFPLSMRSVPRAERAARAGEIARLLGLEALMNRRPSELSGGERQRVAMGRALVRRPRVFLFDEPLSNLDAALRQELRVEIGRLVRGLGATAIYVTHDQTEAMTLGDRLCVMRDGCVLQVGTPREIYEKPATRFVATFVGTPTMNLLRGFAAGSEVHALGRAFSNRWAIEGDVTLGIRPEHMRLGSHGIEGEVLLAEPLGAETYVRFRVGDTELVARERGFGDYAPGQRVHIHVEPAAMHAFEPGEAGLRVPE